jgi:REP element-mobilizing transposase RayT
VPATKFSKLTVGWASVPATSIFMSENTENELWIYRRRMPHWRLTGAVYFVTWRLEQCQGFLSFAESELIASAIRYFDGQRYDLMAYVVMPNHVHILVKPYDQFLLQELVHSWKSFTAHKLQRQYGRQGRIWQEDYFDRIIRDEVEFLEKAQYILNNPLKLHPHRQEYPWVWVKST